MSEIPRLQPIPPKPDPNAPNVEDLLDLMDSPDPCLVWHVFRKKLETQFFGIAIIPNPHLSDGSLFNIGCAIAELEDEKDVKEGGVKKPVFVPIGPLHTWVNVGSKKFFDSYMKLDFVNGDYSDHTITQLLDNKVKGEKRKYEIHMDGLFGTRFEEFVPKGLVLDVKDMEGKHRKIKTLIVVDKVWYTKKLTINLTIKKQHESYSFDYFPVAFTMTKFQFDKDKCMIGVDIHKLDNRSMDVPDWKFMTDFLSPAAAKKHRYTSDDYPPSEIFLDYLQNVAAKLKLDPFLKNVALDLEDFVARRIWFHPCPSPDTPTRSKEVVKGLMPWVPDGPPPPLPKKTQHVLELGQDILDEQYGPRVSRNSTAASSTYAMYGPKEGLTLSLTGTSSLPEEITYPDPLEPDPTPFSKRVAQKDPPKSKFSWLDEDVDPLGRGKVVGPLERTLTPRFLAKQGTRSTSIGEFEARQGFPGGPVTSTPKAPPQEDMAADQYGPWFVAGFVHDSPEPQKDGTLNSSDHTYATIPDLTGDRPDKRTSSVGSYTSIVGTGPPKPQPLRYPSDSSKGTPSGKKLPTIEENVYVSFGSDKYNEILPALPAAVKMKSAGTLSYDSIVSGKSATSSKTENTYESVGSQKSIQLPPAAQQITEHTPPVPKTAIPKKYIGKRVEISKTLAKTKNTSDSPLSKSQRSGKTGSKGETDPKIPARGGKTGSKGETDPKIPGRGGKTESKGETYPKIPGRRGKTGSKSETDPKISSPKSKLQAKKALQLSTTSTGTAGSLTSTASDSVFSSPQKSMKSTAGSQASSVQSSTTSSSKGSNFSFPTSTPPTEGKFTFPERDRGFKSLTKPGPPSKGKQGRSWEDSVQSAPPALPPRPRPKDPKDLSDTNSG